MKWIGEPTKDTQAAPACEMVRIERNTLSTKENRGCRIGISGKRNDRGHLYRKFIKLILDMDNRVIETWPVPTNSMCASPHRKACWALIARRPSCCRSRECSMTGRRSALPQSRIVTGTATARRPPGQKRHGVGHPTIRENTARSGPRSYAIFFRN